MSRRKLVDVSLFPEDSASSSKGAKIDPTPSVKDVVPVKSVSPVAEPVTVSLISKRRRFPKRPVCTDDIRSSPSPHPFVSTGGSSSTFKMLSKGRRASSLSSSFKNARDIAPMDPTSAPGSKYMLPFWSPSSGLDFKYNFRLLIPHLIVTLVVDTLILRKVVAESQAPISGLGASSSVYGAISSPAETSTGETLLLPSTPVSPVDSNKPFCLPLKHPLLTSLTSNSPLPSIELDPSNMVVDPPLPSSYDVLYVATSPSRVPKSIR